ncbi:hypothetical protein L873DRAFT_1707406 [Choiromyces venosus 120613-1]|uniref:F-box domain-containing protein n=1 Tax=Choiromyces venosus 120613-1 TaxID=1336337 RepID=A0A3N4IWU7_9PEZI|nr:hypothetical protein L873DRAFT_1724805 [Choiromyces venosus 120613-1]RPA92937.1 hypothetical protein L873DRAFT_1707406 [Choiromyces venosus 120613-1]
MAARKSRRQNYRYFDLSLLQSRRSTKRPPLNAICEIIFPRDIHSSILGHLEASHKDPLEPSCATCLARDLSSYSKVCMEWHAAAIPHLYGKIFIAGADSPELKRRMKMRNGCRAWLLRKTLLVRPDFAAMVKQLKFPEYQDLTAKESKENGKFIVSIVQLCPHLERLEGHYPEYKVGAKDSIQTALLSRDFLKEHIWTIGSEGPMQLAQSESFVNAHIRWTKLETLIMQGGSGNKAGSMSHLTFAGLFERLPSLKKLLVARFHDYEFDNNTLQAVPDQIEYLRLEELPGVTDAGVSEYVEQASVHCRIRSLSLIELELLSMLLISKIFSRLAHLEKFTLVQTSSPQLPLESSADKSKPAFASTSLQLLHWDVLIPGPANVLLARSIHSSAFPALKAVRAPSDHHGVIQAVCKPLEQIVLPFDKIEARLLRAQQKQREDKYFYPEIRYSRSLPQARINAQERIESARKSTFMRIVVTEGSAKKEGLSVDLKAFMGDWKSKVKYELLPDLWGSEFAVLTVAGLLNARVSTEWKPGDGVEMCCGKWNSTSFVGGRGVKWEGHTERTPGMRDMELAMLF